ncbi:P-loop containing nucleoside triphosphate hydrolase protein [Globomyces pollinis-pini]|nr:P-loop containing nucleoside triphosphate hydrolase protein [Globomyces pollinis-pini]
MQEIIQDEVEQKPNSNFNVPKSLLKSSKARLDKIKQLQDDRISSSDSEFNHQPISTKKKNLNKTQIPNIKNKINHPDLNLHITPIPNQQSNSPNQSRRVSNVVPTSGVVYEMEKMRLERQERRDRQMELKKVKDGMNDIEKQSFVYRQTIDSFRLDFAMARSNLNIKRLESVNTDKNQPKIKVPYAPTYKIEMKKGIFDIITTATDHHPYAHIYLHEPKVKLDLGLDINTHRFVFDHVFDEYASNEMVYMDTTDSLVASFLDGGRSTLFAYGQTGSGKTHTVFGDDNITGLYAYVCTNIFKNLPKDSILTISFVEIYGERIYDLFSTRSKVQLLEDGKGMSQLVGQEEYQITSVEQMMGVIERGVATRTTGTTNANSHSSRSHAIVQICLRNVDGSVKGKFSLVDLAGSERGVDVGNVDRKSRKEGSEINKSLLALKECIRIIYLQRTGRMEKGSHIPFRSSKLTQILRDSFIGKKSQTVMIAMISPGSNSADHTLNTLRYADRVKEFTTSDVVDLPSPTESQVQTPDFETPITTNDVFEDLDDEEVPKQPASSSLGLELSPTEFKLLDPPSKLPKSTSVDSFQNNPGLRESVLDLVLKLNDPINETIMQHEETIIENHLHAVAAAAKLTRKERQLLLDVSQDDRNIKEYVNGSIEIVNARLQLWNELKVDLEKHLSLLTLRK